MNYLGLLFTSIVLVCVFAAKETWNELVVQVAKEHFPANVILVWNFLEVEAARNGLTAREDDGIEDLLEKLATNWSVITADESYQPEKISLHRSMVLSKARQVIIYIDEALLEMNETLQVIVVKCRQHVSWHDGAKILIVAKTENGLQLARNIFNVLWSHAKIVHVAFLAWHTPDLHVFTWVPYNANCSIDVTPLGKFSNNQKLPIFASKFLKNANKCIVSGTAYPNVPYVFPPNKSGHFYDGLELRIFKELSHYLNFTITVQALPLEMEKYMHTRQIAVNGTPVGPMRMLARGETDIMLWGRILSYERALYADAILPSYYSDDLIWVGPTPRRSPKWKAVFLVFTRPVWLVILVVFVISLNTVNMIARMSQGVEPIPFSYVFLFMWATELSNSQPIPKQLTRVLFRLFHSCFLFYIITVNALYSSGLYGVLSHGLRIEDINTPEKAAESGMSVTLFPPYRSVVKYNKPLFYNYITSRNLVSWTFDRSECKNNAVKFKSCFYLSTALEAEYDINSEYRTTAGESYLRIYPGRFIPANPVFYMTKNHPLGPAFSPLIQRLIESGWIEREARRLLNDAKHHRQIALVVLNAHQEEAKKELTMEKLLGAFVVLVINAMLAILALLGEILVKRLRTQSKRRNTFIKRHTRISTLKEFKKNKN